MYVSFRIYCNDIYIIISIVGVTSINDTVPIYTLFYNVCAFPLRIHQIHRISGAIGVGAEGVVLLALRIEADEHAVRRLEARLAVIPGYVKDRGLELLAAIKVVTFSRNQRRIVAFFAVGEVIDLLDDRAEAVYDYTGAAEVVGDEVAGFIRSRR